MRLSIVIVNYNVKYFLEQCLESVFHSDLEGAQGPIDLEVFVVDNASVDGSVEMIREKYPQVHLIANTDNTGFARANNQALRIATGDFLLLLNPDTIVERDTLRKCVDFYAQHPDCGGLSVKMVNGEGVYLKESKRGFPTPAASFYKISGLIRLFPHSERIAAYYMGHLSNEETNEVDILPGAYIIISREALEKVGLLDETYFMYGEDIDFSWRIHLAGYKNYYYPETRIIHYKGESTRHGSMNYVYTFYNAMSIFVKRYFSGSGAWLFNALLHLAIWARAGLAFMKRILQAIALPVADFALAFGGFVALKDIWATYWAENVNYYPTEYTWVVIPIYILLLMLTSWLYGGYERPVKTIRILKGMAIGSLVLLIFYSLLDESQRYSRALLLLGCLWTILSTLGIRGILCALNIPGFSTRAQRKRPSIVIGSANESSRVKSLYLSLGAHSVETLVTTTPTPQQINDVIHCYHADELIFCGKDISVQQIISLMIDLSQIPGRRHVNYKIVPSESDFIIGSNSIHSTEDLYSEELQTVATPLNSRNKRLFDFFTAAFFILFSPILFWFQHRKRQYFLHCFQVLIGKKSWVGQSAKTSIFAPHDIFSEQQTAAMSPEILERLALRYARNYKVTSDLTILLKNLSNV